MLRADLSRVLGAMRIALLVLVVCAVTRADVLTLNDGRQFQGRKRSETPDIIQFDTVISGIQATLSFKPDEVKSLDTKSLPEGFFEGADPAAAGADQPATEETLFLEIPIVGRLKEQVFVQAVQSTLAYAKREGVRHIVFTVDSNGGPLDEAILLYRKLREYEGDLTYHSIIKNCTGEALVVPFLSESLHLMPGCTIGGANQSLENVPARWAKQAEEVVREQIAENLETAARQRGRKGQIIKAMFDPQIILAAWQDSSGEVVSGSTPPTDLPAERLIFQDGPDSVLVLSFDQARKLGVPEIKGGVNELGSLLGLPGWREQSDRGRSDMNKAIAFNRRKAANAQAKFEDSIARNVRLRQTTVEAIQYNLKQAANYNPTTASYKTLSGYFNAGWDPYATFDTKIWTPESQQRWRDRTEACGFYLERAIKGIQSMISLDKEAATLGLSPTYRSDELLQMLDDASTKLTMLNRNRNRIGE